MKTKKLSQSEYCPTLKPWNREEMIQNQVNREAEVMADIPRPEPAQEYVKQKVKIPLSAGMWNLVRQMLP